MGTFRVELELGDPQGRRFEAVQAVVDTGATYTWAPASLLTSLGVAPSYRFPFVLADGRRVEKDMAETKVRLNGQVRTTLVVFGDEGTLPLLGAYTLEGFGLAPDPVNRRLMSVPGLLVAVSIRDNPFESLRLTWREEPADLFGEVLGVQEGELVGGVVGDRGIGDAHFHPALLDGLADHLGYAADEA